VSQVEGFNDNDNDNDNDMDMDIAVTGPLVPAATRPKGAGDPAAAEGPGAQGPALGANRRDSRWPRWPTAWPDGSLRSR
jgi:hypothetical protein